MTTCQHHADLAASGRCRTCRQEFCSDCLVYPYGPAKPPHCIRCALHAAGEGLLEATPSGKAQRAS